MSDGRFTTRLRIAGLTTLLVASVAVLLDLHQPVLTAFHRGHPTARTVVFVVLDTVRADHLSACGYGRPTSPTLERLVADGATLSCRAVAPGAWTLPSHASFFTGVGAPEHGAHYVAPGPGAESLFGKFSVRMLGDERPTLAEGMAAAGYRTVSVSANPVVGPATGLTRGFERAWIGDDLVFDSKLVEAVRSEVREARDDDRPLFLFVNIVDAHDPWRAIPADVDWAPPRDPLDFRRGAPDDPMTRFVRGELPAAEARPFLAHVTDVYDYGIWRADRALGQVLEVLDDHGWLDEGLRLVVTSDHGEFLGEHGLLAHGHAVWEPVVRVPVLIHEFGHEKKVMTRPPLPEPLNALHVFHLVRDGRLPPALAPVEAAAWPDEAWRGWFGGTVGVSTSAARWAGDSKRVWVDGVTSGYDLATDPGEQRPSPFDDDPVLDELVQRVRASAAGGSEVSPETLELLRAAGYVE